MLQKAVPQMRALPSPAWAIRACRLLRGRGGQRVLQPVLHKPFCRREEGPTRGPWAAHFQIKTIATAAASAADAAAAAAAAASHVLKRLAPYMTPCATAPIKTDQVATASGGGGGGAEAAGGSRGGGSGGDGGGSDGGGSNSGGGRAAARDCAAAAPSAARFTSSEATTPAADKDLCSICLGELSGLQATSIYTHIGT